MPGPFDPRKPGMSGMGPLPNDEYGDAQTMTDPRYSRQLNSNIAAMHPTDANMASANPNQRLEQVFQKGMELFGPDGMAEIMDEVLRIAISQETNDQQVTGNLDTTGMPPPDFGDQQPYTTMAPTDSNMAALEAHYGYPVSANKSKRGPVRNLPNDPMTTALMRSRR